MGESERFDIDVLREILWRGMTNEEYRNFQNLEEDFDEDPDVLREILRQGMTNEEYRNFQRL